MKFSLDQSATVAVLMAFLLIALGCLSLIGIGNLVETSQWVEHTQVVIDRLQILLTEIQEESMATRNLLLTGNSDYLQSFQNARQMVPSQLQALKELTSDNPARQSDFVKLEALMNQHMVIMERLSQSGERVPLPSTAQQVEEDNKLMGQIRAQITSMQVDERLLLQQRAANALRSSTLVKSIIITGSFIGLMILLGNTLSLRRAMTMRGRAEETLRQSEERSRLIIESAHDAFISIDIAGRIRDWNLQAESMFGWPRLEALGRFLHETIIPPKYRADHLRGIAHLKATGEGPVLNKTIELTALRRNGDEFPVELVIWPLQMGNETTFHAFVRDITSRKEAAERIQKLNEELKQRAEMLGAANKELESFSYTVSHDLRAPLRHIHGFVELLQKSPAVRGDESNRRYMSIISRAANVMGQLIDDLLAFAKTNRAEMHPVTIDMREMVGQVIRDLGKECRERKVTWEVKPLSGVAADSNLLRLVWLNLLDNALKYTRPHPEAKIEIGQVPSDHNGAGAREAVFYVRDDGVGFDMQYASKLFGVFQRLHRAEDFEGTGIGLANVQRIIHRHGGRVWAEGRVDAGATFYFSLPVNASQPP